MPTRCYVLLSRQIPEKVFLLTKVSPCPLPLIIGIVIILEQMHATMCLIFKCLLLWIGIIQTVIGNRLIAGRKTKPCHECRFHELYSFLVEELRVFVIYVRAITNRCRDVEDSVVVWSVV
jgi:hypothetical protein